jgi:hypothetical protein
MDQDELRAEVEEALADRVARLVTQKLSPGMGSMILPGYLTDAIAGWTSTTWRHPVYTYADELWIQSTVLPAQRSIQLSLEFNGGQRVWTGLLRPGLLL